MFLTITVLTFKLHACAKLNCLKWNFFDIETVLTLVVSPPLLRSVNGQSILP